MPGTLYVVATPIGNLADASPRALEALRKAAVVACEDTRTTGVLLAHFGIPVRSVALHRHNERKQSAALVAELLRGNDVALVSDAGTPGISDPGALLVAQAHAAGAPVVPVPGPNAAAAALSASGFQSAGHVFAGFLPAAPAARRKALAALDAPVPIVFYEAPHRVLETVVDLEARFGGAHEIVIARELTKKFEEIARMPLGAAAEWLRGPHRQQGEFVLVLAPGAPGNSRESDAGRVLAILREALPPGEAARLASRITGAPKNALYRSALARSTKSPARTTKAPSRSK
jgi:16S rRNA (cytidine1402-2'-O)-methyltransferase